MIEVEAQHPAMNGQAQEQIAQSLMDEATVGYIPTMPTEAMWAGNADMPQVTLRRDLWFMQLHPIVETALLYYKAGISGAEFWGGPDQANPDNEQGKPISPDPTVSQFVLAHCERFWQRGVPEIQEEGYVHGWSPGEHVYKEIDAPTQSGSKMLVWSHLKTFQPTDGHILTMDYQPIGVRIKGIRNSPPVNLHLASESVPAKGCWYAHRPRSSSLHGRSQLTAAWLPWRMIGWRDGMDQVINAAVYRAGYRGPIVKHPPGESAVTSQDGIPATRTDGSGRPRRANRDVARQVVEWAKAGAGFTLPSDSYPTSEGGGEKWSVDFPEHVMDVRPLIEAARWAEDRIMLGIGVPPELVKAGGTGSGYSGRSIPREAFLDQQQRVADAMLQMFVEQVIRPLVLWNFGDISFNVQVKSLLKSQAGDKQGDEQAGGEEGGQPDNLNKSQAAKDSWAKRKGGAGNDAEGKSPEPAAMSLDDHHRSKILDLVRRVMSKRRSA